MPMPKSRVEADQQQGHRENGRRQHENDRRRIKRPQEQRQPIPGEPRRAQPMDGDDEVQAGEDRGKAGDEHAGRRQHDVAVGIHRRERRVERPAGIDAADEKRIERHQAARHEQIPARQIEPGKGEIARADHQRDDEITERRGDRRDQKKPHHDHAVNGEQPVVGVRGHEVALRR